ncbi:hypothetical protein EV144_101996 [Flavobacterium sp. 270]|uniref:hypothetical protein n=1 Tax=Flavobacterium sp. 270 TaxID=2512114 RepID=UPI001065B53D|nr:hypothetical protein [Flavobacterium sp. 270]TDW52307.1 hypothetical protein EV144_101996 [Flavobacterium sp. 270]
MEAIRLEFQPEIKEKILKLLSSFSSDELKIVEEDSFSDPDFEQDKKKLKERAAKIENGTVQYSTFEELDVLLEDTISKYED